ncbi:MAG: hypothetical protein COA60_004130 [Robiginitomaculum sp.]|nr:hypothetical protein [Robiginitomaculum sp.]
MLDNIWTEYLKERLAEELAVHKPPQQNHQSLPERWIAMSLMQKAIRRSDSNEALRAGLYLLNVDYRILWRRLCVIAWEDISFGDFDLCGMITAASGSKRWRAKVGGEWKVASYLISQLCAAQKNRVTDDIVTLVNHDASLEVIRRELAIASVESLQSIANSHSGLLLQRVIATWYALGTQKFGSDVLHRRKGDVDHFFTCFDTDQCPEHVLAICRVALSRSGTILPAFIPLLWNDWMKVTEPLPSNTDNGLQSYSINSIPRYAFDGHTRAGRRYLYWLADQSNDLQQFLQDVVPKADKNALLRELCFKTISALCVDRQAWSVTDSVRLKADQVGYGLTAASISQGMQILRVSMNTYPMTEKHL